MCRNQAGVYLVYNCIKDDWRGQCAICKRKYWSMYLRKSAEKVSLISVEISV